MFNNSTMKKSDLAAAGGQAHSPATVAEEGWVGFVCKECGAPLGIHRSNNGSRAGERSARGWRVTCTGCGVTEFYELGSPMVRITVT
jgi:predicted nucleic-acid-binding Zn-ribbon protein